MHDLCKANITFVIVWIFGFNLERKWKAAVSSPVRTLRNSAKELSSEELEKLTKVCSSHQQ